jgi:hypothetical protein
MPALRGENCPCKGFGEDGLLLLWMSTDRRRLRVPYVVKGNEGQRKFHAGLLASAVLITGLFNSVVFSWITYPGRKDNE